MIEVTEWKEIGAFGAIGDGRTDDSAAFCAAFAGGFAVHIPAGEYRIAHTLTVHSHTAIRADKDAHIFLADGSQTKRGDYLLTTDFSEEDSTDILIDGGVWDGNCAGNSRGDDIFDPTATTGVMMNFRRVKDLTLTNMEVKNPLCYYFRFCEAECVKMTHIRFTSDYLGNNQDGVHFAGFCRDFTIDDLYGAAGSPNDDFLAFNADDALYRQEGFDVENGPIENFRVSNIHSDECHCFLRLLSVTSQIRNIIVTGLRGVCKHYFLNMDMGRECRVKVFREEEYPNGVGKIEHIRISDCDFLSTDRNDPAFSFGGNVRDFVMENIRCTDDSQELFALAHLAPHEIRIEGIRNRTETGLYARDVTATDGGIAGTIGQNEAIVFRSAGFEKLTLSRKED